ncbi:methylated-DNA--[protein]-cysteine S-methyltransferase [Actinopolymorpha pittospori]|uniref:Methylated-DNA--protein-cysteine methyltransferase n=1 Tax=Actinopolymorpha pittospori TaxID=648752 RepID=A0A927N5C4_9ACTN|nr:methylated-DNA--[protein]-cysteine S-methyltransferase [Actinopolymorpha pittospori]MBE1609252.1 methylated-DNA-[protein]-cysteine S-methyltransferase [Actinopolymorpha pittospori]
MATRHTLIETELGEITLVADEGRLAGLYFRHHWYKPPQESLGAYVEPDTDPLFTATAAELEDYLAGRRTSFDVPITAAGDEFQKRVWALLEEIPYGRTTTYGALAEKLGDRSLAQEVGRAVGHNPLSVIVPCHRVVGRDGKLTGYAGGLRRKKLLLDLEEPSRAKAERLF